MNRKTVSAARLLLSLFILLTMLCGCGVKKDTAESSEAVSNDTSVSAAQPPETEDAAEEILSDEQALSAIRSYCYTLNPNLEDIVNAEEYPVYWDIASSDEHEIVVLFRSYTGAQNRYYIDRITGETYVTEYVPGITPEEQQTDESFNIRDYLSDS